MEFRFVLFVARFATCLFAVSIPLAILWAATLPGHVYQCVDGFGTIFDYYFPGWVHDPVRVVDRINPAADMSDGDSILKGWGRTWL